MASAQDLNKSRAQALQALLHSLSPESSSSQDQPLTPDQVSKLSQKIIELVGNDDGQGAQTEKTDLVNDEGLPIIDITEALPSANLPPAPPPIIPDPELLPPAPLTAAQHALLDALELEEAEEQLHAGQADEGARRADIERRKSAAKLEIDRLQAVRDMQRRMGRALVHDTGVQEKKWGDVTAERLRARGAEKMRTNVVERKREQEGDSDDESVPGSSGGNMSDVEEGVGAGVPPTSASEEDESDEEPTLEQEEYDLDNAAHQRQIALEYYTKRNTVGAEALRAMTAHTHGEGEDEWDQPEVPLEATLAMPHPKPAVSHFMATRRSVPVASASLGPSVVPASQYRSAQRAIRTGRFEDGKLVGGPAGESGSEDDDVKEILELLSKGDVQNFGPGLSPGTSTSTSATAVSSSPASSAAPAPAPKKPKESRFKLMRQGGPSRLAPIPAFSPASAFNSEENTPVSTAWRSSPKSPTAPEVVERRQPSMVSAHTSVVTSPSDPSIPSAIASPSFPSPSPPSVVVSPSFPSAAPPSIVVSPSFPPTSRRPDRPPAVMSTSVREAGPGGRGAADVQRAEGVDGGRVSRFMAERRE